MWIHGILLPASNDMREGVLWVEFVGIKVVTNKFEAHVQFCYRGVPLGRVLLHG